MARYTPGIVDDQIVNNELQKIAEALDTPDKFLMLSKLYAAPPKPREGMVVLADGVNWKPTGAATPGAYIYYGAAWHFMG